MNDYELHARLIGQQGGRQALNTPVLIVDGDALARNIEAMAAFAEAKGVRLRPHAKTHKSAHVAKLQIEAGAIGVCCAKLGEAEALADAGVENILITSPVVTAQGIERLTALHARTNGLMVVADNPINVDALALAARDAGAPLAVLVDIDPGIRRTGVATPEAALGLVEKIRRSPSLVYRGVQFYCGVQQHIGSFAERRAAIEERTGYLQSILERLNQAGAAPAIVTGSGTGTHRIDADFGVFTEWQVGSYVFMDRQYNDCDLTGDGVPYETALSIDARIVSANTPGMATIDAGFKAMATDGGPPTIVAGAPADAAYAFMGDEHGAVFAPGGAFELGGLITLAAPHCDPTVNLYDFYHVVRGDTLVDIWPITARGRSR